MAFNVSLEGIGGLVSGLGTAAKDFRAAITGKSVTDPTAQAELEMKALELANKAQEIENVLATAQIEVNKTEAASGDKFASRWRPAAAWVGVLGFLWISFIDPVGRWIATVFFNYTGSFPPVDTNITMAVLGGLLGFGTMRTTEYIKGVLKK